MNINAITKANVPVMLGGHEMWVGVMFDSCFSVAYKKNG